MIYNVEDAKHSDNLHNEIGSGGVEEWRNFVLAFSTVTFALIVINKQAELL